MEENKNTEKSFSQEDVNRIVSERLKNERSKYTTEIEQREADLKQREAAFNNRVAIADAKADWSEKGYPSELIDYIDITKPGVKDAVEKVLSEANMAKNQNPVIQPRMGDIGNFSDDNLRKAMGLK